MRLQLGLVVSSFYLFAPDVGRSCILLYIGGKRIMLDCGMHMGFNDQVSLWRKFSSSPKILLLQRRFPDFSYIGAGPVTEYIDCVIIRQPTIFNY